MELLTRCYRNIAITDINPQYVWGGDAITINQADNVWIDHVTVRAHVGLEATIAWKHDH